MRSVSNSIPADCSAIYFVSEPAQHRWNVVDFCRLGPNEFRSGRMSRRVVTSNKTAALAPSLIPPTGRIDNYSPILKSQGRTISTSNDRHSASNDPRAECLNLLK